MSGFTTAITDAAIDAVLDYGTVRIRVNSAFVGQKVSQLPPDFLGAMVLGHLETSAVVDFGATVAGSSIKPVGFRGTGFSQVDKSTAILSGTWMVCGYVGGNISSTLFKRVV